MRSQEKSGRWYGPATLAILALGFIGGATLERMTGIGLPPSGAWASLRLISQAWSLINRFYVDRAAVQARTMTYGALSGMVDALGDTGHSRFLSPQMVKEVNEIEQSKFQGIGAEVHLKGGHVVIVVPLDGSPAQRAGLRSGDIILQVNGRNVTGRPLDEVVSEISGPAGTEVTLTILPPASGNTRQVTLTRAKIIMHNVTWQKLPQTKFVHLRIADFSSDVSADLRKALTEIKKAPTTGIILDLRNNPGGLLEQAVEAASQFLKGGNVLLVKNARGQEKPVPVKPGGEATEIPMVVLVNGGTASGAEIVAGALQDAHRAPLVGEATFGTGTVLNEFKLSDGSALLLAIEEWLTPAGHVIWHKGITPGFVVALAAGVSPVFPETERTMNAEQIDDSDDAQLLRALELLRQKESPGTATALRTP
jgi:carboxyl-terminal processing protease